jgi:predicted short-subunit dehydrogenase-like oxidoreductase (DUF2520 family)
VTPSRSSRYVSRLRVAIIGAGNVGLVLGRLLVERRNVISSVVSRTQPSARRGGRFLQCRNVSTSVAAIPANTDLIMITTPHHAVESVAQDLSRLDQLNFGRIAVCHASGVLTAAVLEPVRQRGAVVFSFHPLQTFPRNFSPRDIVDSARGIYYGIDGSRAGVRMAQRLAAELGGAIVEIPPEMRALYHAACVVASNHLTTMLWILEEMFTSLHTRKRHFFEVFKPIILATLRNVEATSPSRALSGPVARGGVETVAEHFSSLGQYLPDLLPYYALLSRETVKLAVKKGSIDAARAEALATLIHNYVPGIPLMQETP